MLSLLVGFVGGLVVSAAIAYEAISDEWDPHGGWSGIKQRFVCKAKGHAKLYPNPDEKICSRCGTSPVSTEDDS